MPETIRLLRDAGADPTVIDFHGETPLSWASRAGRPVEVLRPLLFPPHRIHPDHRPMRENLVGRPLP
jgi:ankyrin repeat protein